MVFHLAGQAYALPLTEVKEVVPMAGLSRPPGLPSVLAGFLNLAGTAVPVIRLGRLFEVAEPTLGPYTPLIILRHPDYRVALLVEKVSDILAVPEEAILPVQENHSFNDCADGMITAGGRVVLLLSAERILLEKEHQCLAEFRDREQARLRELEEARPVSPSAASIPGLLCRPGVSPAEGSRDPVHRPGLLHRQGRRPGQPDRPETGPDGVPATVPPTWPCWKQGTRGGRAGQAHRGPHHRGDLLLPPPGDVRRPPRRGPAPDCSTRTGQAASCASGAPAARPGRRPTPLAILLRGDLAAADRPAGT